MINESIIISALKDNNNHSKGFFLSKIKQGWSKRQKEANAEVTTAAVPSTATWGFKVKPRQKWTCLQLPATRKGSSFVAILYLLYLCRLCMTTAYNTIAGDVLRYNNMKKTKLTTFTALVQKRNSTHIKTRHRMQMLNGFKVSKTEKNVSLKSRQDAEPCVVFLPLLVLNCGQQLFFLNQQASLLAVSC